MRKHTHRTVRDPRAWITKRSPLAPDQQTDLSLAYHASLQAMLRGHGTRLGWDTIGCSLNIALVLCELGFSSGKIDNIKHAQAALLTSRTRAEKLCKWGFSGDEARAVMDACNIHDDQLAKAPRKQVDQALAEVRRRIQVGEFV